MSEEKEKVEEIEEESSLEETIEEVESEIQKSNVDENKFIEFFEARGGKAPVLEQVQIASQSRITDLESSAFESGPVTNSKEKDNFSYSVGGNQENEAKYIEDPNIEGRNVVKQVSSVNPMELGKEDLFKKPEISFAPSRERGPGKVNVEKYVSPKKFNPDHSKKQDMFKKPEVKYKPSK